MSDLRPPTAQGGSFPWDPRDISLVQGPPGNPGAPGEPGPAGEVPDNVVLTDGSTPIVGNQEVQGTLIAESTSAQRIKASGDGATAGIKFGSAEDVNLYRSAPDTLMTDDDLGAKKWMVAAHAHPGQVAIGYTGPAAAAGVLFGSAGDVNLYRKADGILRTDHAFEANYTIAATAGLASKVELGWMGPSSEAGIAFGVTGALKLYRLLEDVLMVSNNLYAKGAVGASQGTADQVTIGSGQGPAGAGGVSFRNGDSSIYWESASVLRATGHFKAGYDLHTRPGAAEQAVVGSVGPAGEAGLRFGSADDTNLYRSAADILRTDDQFRSGSYITAFYGQPRQVQLGDGTNAGIVLGSASDTNLYRYASDFLRTDDDFATLLRVIARHGTANEVSLGMVGAATAGPGILFGSAKDVNFYRSNVVSLKTDGHLAAGFDFIAREGASAHIKVGSLPSAAPGIQFGTALDTNLYRFAADTLKTDDTLGAARLISGHGGGTEIDLNPSGFIRLGQIGTPGAPIGGRMQLFLRDNAGKGQLCALFPTGAVQIIANEP